MVSVGRGTSDLHGKRPITVHHVIGAFLALAVVLGSSIAQAFFANRPWVKAIVGGPRLVMFWAGAGAVLYLVDRWVCATKWYRTSILARELSKPDPTAAARTPGS